MEKETARKPSPQTFWLSDDSAVSETQLKTADRDVQIDAMRNWFHSNFIDPVHETPYDSGEGGYQFIHGGPYDAEDELFSRFGDVVPEDVIEELVEELENESSEWAPRTSSDYDLTDYDEYALEALAPLPEHFKTFSAAIDKIVKLSTTHTDAAEQQFFRRLLFAGAITALETYLSDVFISSIKDNPRALRKFVESFPAFQAQRVKKCDIFKELEQLEHLVRSFLVGRVLWHRLEPVAKMFKNTFDIDFTQAPIFNQLERDIETRHDIVHRSGKDKNGSEHNLSGDDIYNLTARCVSLVQEIERQRGNFAPIVWPER